MLSETVRTMRMYEPNGLNPCFSGICSLSTNKRRRNFERCLNPCFSGICSLSPQVRYIRINMEVLILVLVEYALWDSDLVDNYLWKCLNPCFSGICSLRAVSRTNRKQIDVLILVLVEYALWAEGDCAEHWKRQEVLILVLVEYALWEHRRNCQEDCPVLCLNPCFSGICSLRLFYSLW